MSKTSTTTGSLIFVLPLAQPYRAAGAYSRTDATADTQLSDDSVAVGAGVEAAFYGYDSAFRAYPARGAPG